MTPAIATLKYHKEIYPLLSPTMNQLTSSTCCGIHSLPHPLPTTRVSTTLPLSNIAEQSGWLADCKGNNWTRKQILTCGKPLLIEDGVVEVVVVVVIEAEVVVAVLCKGTEEL